MCLAADFKVKGCSFQPLSTKTESSGVNSVDYCECFLHITCYLVYILGPCW